MTRAWGCGLGLLALLVAQPSARAAPPFSLSVAGLIDGATLPQAQAMNGFGCSGGNRSPPLSWTPPPPGTLSLAVTVFDPDAPAGWWHWGVFNLPSTTTSLPENAGSPGTSLAGAAQGRTTYGTLGYSGPCPPAGAPHHYVITVWALRSARLPFAAGVPDAVLAPVLQQYELATASVTLRFGR